MDVARMATIVGVALIGALVGSWATAMIILLSWRRTRRNERRRRFWGRWLAARLSLSRAAIALVTAQRAASESSRGSDRSWPDQMRVEEVNRARTEWYRALRDWDGVRALLLADPGSPGVQDSDRLGEPISSEALRQAMTGSEQAWKRFAQSLQADDRAALSAVRAAVSGASIFRSGGLMRNLFDGLRLTWRTYVRIVEGWGLNRSSREPAVPRVRVRAPGFDPSGRDVPGRAAVG